MEEEQFDDEGNPLDLYARDRGNVRLCLPLFPALHDDAIFRRPRQSPSGSASWRAHPRQRLPKKQALPMPRLLR